MRIAVSCRLDKVNQRDFAKSISKADADVEVYFITDSQNYPALDGISQQRVYHVQPAWPYFVALNAHHPANKSAYRDVLEQINPDVLLSLGVSNLRFMGPVAGFSPTVLLPQGGETTRFIEPWHDSLKARLYWRMYRYQFKRALNGYDAIWSCKPNESIYREFGFENKFIDFDWGVVDTNQFRPREDAVAYGEPSDTVIGSFRRQRGDRLLPSYDTFFDAIGKLHGVRDDFHVVIGGFYENEKGNDIKKLIERKISRYGLEDIVTKVGMVRKEEMPRHYSGLDVYMNFTHKGHPITGLGTASKEAMACECAYVTFDDPPKDHIIDHGENGYIVSHSGPERLSEILASLCANEDLQHSMGTKARETVSNNFSQAAIANGAISLCRNRREQTDTDN